MKRNISTKLLFIAAIAAFITGCASKAAVVSTAPAAAPVVTPALPDPEVKSAALEKLNVLRAKKLEFNTVSARAKGVLTVGTASNDVNMNIRIKDGEAIWVSVTALAGLEVARALITPDSVKILNRLENQYIVRPFSYLQEFTNKQITFDMLQAILLGEAVATLLTDDASVDISATGSRINSPSAGLQYSLTTDESDQVTSATLRDGSTGKSLQVNYGSFADVAGRTMPHLVSLRSASGPKNLSVELQFSRIERDMAIEMPFRVPDRFVQKN